MMEKVGLVVKILFKFFRVIGIIFGFGVIIVYIFELKSIVLNYGFQKLDFECTLTRIMDFATLSAGIIFIVPFGKFKNISQPYNNIIFLFLVVFEVYLCIYYIRDFEWFIPFSKEKVFVLIIILLEILVPLLNIYIFFCEVIKTNKESNIDDEVMSEFLDS